jgi:Flp pilus assembly pilin Flp
MRTRRFIKNEEGAAVVEFALVMPILVLLVFGIIDFGRAFYTVNNIISAVREGARYGAILAAPMSPAGQQEIKDRVRSVSQPFGGDTLRDDQIRIEFPNAELVRVRVENYPFEPLVPIANWFGFATWPITRQASFRWERGT